MTTNDSPEWLLDAAEAIARQAHAGAQDKIGFDYIDHPRRVAAGVTSADAKAVAWLHDVIEDTNETSPITWTSDMLLAVGFPSHIVEAVTLMTRTDDVDAGDYYRAIRENPLALAVKRSDIADNTAPWRVALLEPAKREALAAKYAHALKVLGSPAS